MIIFLLCMPTRDTYHTYVHTHTRIHMYDWFLLPTNLYGYNITMSENRNDTNLFGMFKDLGKLELNENLIPYPNQPHGWKYKTTLSPVVKFVIIISPGESTHVRPNIRLLTFVGGGTKSKTTPSLLRVTRVLDHRKKERYSHYNLAIN